jgi:hypothetical protein
VPESIRHLFRGGTFGFLPVVRASQGMIVLREACSRSKSQMTSQMTLQMTPQVKCQVKSHDGRSRGSEIGALPEFPFFLIEGVR